MADANAVYGGALEMTAFCQLSGTEVRVYQEMGDEYRKIHEVTAEGAARIL